MYEHAIPQNIMEYEFKLFAGLTLKQFIYVAVSGGFAFGLYELNRAGLFPAFFAWITIPIILLVGVTLGLGSYQKRTMEDWFNAFAKANALTLRRVWKKDTKAVTHDNFHATKPHSLPSYLAVYFMNQDEFTRLMRNKGGVEDSHEPATIVQPLLHAENIPTIQEVIQLTQANATDFAEPGVTLPAIPNTIAFKLQEDNLPMEGVVAYVKDANMSVVGALRSNKDGIVYFNQGFQNGDYEIEFQSPEAATFPKVRVQFQGLTYPLINLSPTGS